MSLRVEGDTTGLALRPAESTATSTTAPTPTGGVGIPSDSAAAGQVDFGALLQAQVADASRLQATATQKVDALARGASDDLHGTMISVKEAEISLKLVGAVRNKLLDAFHELWRINL